MRILVADQDTLLLAAIARTFGRHCELVTATGREACVAQLGERKFDVVVACEELRDYTGLELLTEVTTLSPETLRIFAARPETLKRLGPRLDFFGLLGTLSYPIEARKLLLALKLARGKLAASRPDVRAGARGDAPKAHPSGATKANSASAPRKNAARAPKVRTATVPTAAQREAFQRALARRNAAMRGGGSGTGALGGGAQGRSAHGAATEAAGANGAANAPLNAGAKKTPFISSQSLSDLARMASTKRPLNNIKKGLQQPKRRTIVLGSGIAAAAMAAVVGFHLLRATPDNEHGRDPHRHDVNAHLFSPTSTIVADRSAEPLQVFTPTPPRVVAASPPESAAGLPQPEQFDPETAPRDPPPPPALEHPGPMEPPSMAHDGPPLGMPGVQDGE
jgi:DNA-binding NarL/FixJ family response regulator